MCIRDRIWGGENIRLRERVESGNATLEDVLQHNELFGNYPQLRKTNYIPRDIEKLGRIGGYLPDANTIEIEKQLHNDKYLSKKRDETVIHEIQHAIQNVEGFERGGDHEKLSLIHICMSSAATQKEREATFTQRL